MRFASDALFLAFMLSGALFLAFPGQLYNVGGWAVWVKYVVFLAMAGYFVLYIAYGGSMARRCVIIFAIWNCVLAVSLLAGAPPFRIALYAIPSFSIFAPVSLRDRVSDLAPLILASTAFGALYEYFVIGGFERFAPNGYRGVSIFVNPNNLAITAVVLCAFITSNMRLVRSALVVTLTGAIVLYSGSKTGLIVFGVLILYLAAPRDAAKTLPIGIIVGGVAAIIFVAASLSGFASLPLESTFARLQQAMDFVSTIENPIFPFIGRGEKIYVDNMFLQIWLEVGLPGLLAFFSTLLFVSYRDGIHSVHWVIFGLSAITTNILYLWPVGYLFWLYVGGSSRTSGLKIMARAPHLGSSSL